MSRKEISDSQVVNAYLKSRESLARWPYEILKEEAGQCEKVCLSAMERACNRGYIDYGVSLRSGWVTEEGLMLVEEESR